MEQAFNEGSILRTHVLRPTWHFVTPADIRWMLDLTAPRVHAANAHSYRKLGLDSEVFARSRTALARALRGGKQRTRAELASVLERAGIAAAAGQRLAYLMMDAELEQVICSGPRRGKHTYALLAERAPDAKALTRDQALAELTRRYFSSHGPATLRDFAWWSGLAVREAKLGIELVEPALVRETIGDLTCWSVASRSTAPRASTIAHLLPNYDEYLIAYQDRGLVVQAPGQDAFAHLLVIDGRLAGTWRRTLQKDSVLVETAPCRRLNRVEARALAAAAERYGRFMELPPVLSRPGRQSQRLPSTTTRPSPGKGK